jgi:hypothetical protein
MKGIIFMFLGVLLCFGAMASAETSYNDEGVSITCDVGSDSDVGDMIVMDECLVYSLNDVIISTDVIYIESFEAVVLEVEELPPATLSTYSLTIWRPLSNWELQSKGKSDLYKRLRHHRHCSGIEPIKQC